MYEGEHGLQIGDFVLLILPRLINIESYSLHSRRLHLWPIFGTFGFQLFTF